jgi:hypothetical protein
MLLWSIPGHDPFVSLVLQGLPIILLRDGAVECPGLESFLFMVLFEPLLEMVVQNMKWR